MSTLLSLTEIRRWYRGHETHHFSVEKGVSHDLQINLDIVVPMKCPDLHINVQDASGDRILAGDLLKRESTAWAQWVDGKDVHGLDSGALGEEQEEDTHVGHVLGEVRKRKRKFKKTPRLRRGQGGACRVFGSLEGNKVQGDFHITARGHGYAEFGEHLDHNGMLSPERSQFSASFPHQTSLVSPNPLLPFPPQKRKTTRNQNTSLTSFPRPTQPSTSPT